MKNIRFILGFILGGIICSTIAVYATITYTASQITYKNSNNTEVTLDSALDELYASANIESYTPSNHVTPTTQEQTLYTANKKVTSNIIIDPIPSNYKDLSSSTISSASDVVSGKKAYKSDGTLVTGTAKTASTLTIRLGGSSISKKMGIGNISPSSFSSLFSKFTIDSLTSNINTGCSVSLVKNSDSSQVTPSIGDNTEYAISTYGNIYVKSNSNADNAWNNCNAYITFKN